jgi:hypothetical protein
MFTKKKKKDPTGFLVCQRAHESVAFIRRYTLPRFCKITKTELGACLVLKEPKSILMLLVMKPMIKKKYYHYRIKHHIHALMYILL